MQDAPNRRSGIPSGAATLRHAAIFCFKPAKHGFTRLIRQATAATLLKQSAHFELPLTFAVFKQSERVAHHFAGVVVAPTCHLGVDEFLEVLAEGETAGHMDGTPTVLKLIIIIKCRRGKSGASWTMRAR